MHIQDTAGGKRPLLHADHVPDTLGSAECEAVPPLDNDLGSRSNVARIGL